LLAGLSFLASEKAKKQPAGSKEETKIFSLRRIGLYLLTQSSKNKPKQN
jgi:hypothetical protein